MKKYFFALFCLFIPILSFAAVADNFIYPTSIWDVGTQHGDQMSSGWYHMGTDAGFAQGAGALVYASANGTVKEARERSQFGLVILIEHTLSNNSKIVSLYGHLRPSDVRVTPGQTVSAGDIIGVLGNSSENGGWSPHIHFGIHKNEYTGNWVYSGHVPTEATKDDWYDAENFIPNHLTKDNWSPEVSINLNEDEIISNTKLLNIYATDIGSTIDSVAVQASNDQKNWIDIGSYSGYEMYPYPFYASFSNLDDGNVYIQIKATDEFKNITKKTVKVIKKENASIVKHFSAIKGLPGTGNVKTFYQDGDLKNEFITNGADIAIGDVTGNGSKNIITVNGPEKQTIVKIYSAKGSLLDKFKAWPYKIQNGARIATGDIDGDNKQEIIIGSGGGKRSQVKVFTRSGKLKWKARPYKKNHKKGIDVAGGDIDGDGIDEIIAGSLSGAKSKIAILDENGNRLKVFRAFGKKYKGGVNVAGGDIDGDGIDEIIVGSAGNKKAEVRIFKSNGKRKKYSYIPFGNNFTGAVDVASTDWENDDKDEIIMSQASGGEAWVKTYRYLKNKTTLTNARVFEQGFEGGARIAGW